VAQAALRTISRKRGQFHPTERGPRAGPLASGENSQQLDPARRAVGLISLKATTRANGWGLLQFRYGNEYREEMTWTEEWIDRATTPIVTVGADVVFRPR
jgi:hypothetical protein